MAEEVFPWLKSLPLAPEYHPTPIEFEDPIAYIFKIEEEASRYGICKIVPPCSVSSTKAIIANLNRTLSSQNLDSSPTFSTRQQQIGFCPRKNQHPVQRSVWQSGKSYTLPQFKRKSKRFEKNQLKKASNLKRDFTALELETLYWKAQFDKQIKVEYLNDMPGSAFDETGQKQGKKEVSNIMNVEDSQWNTRRAARANGSLLKFLTEEIPGVTSPMIYIGMLYSWFAWHVEDHDLHSLNYMHMGAAKTWYGVPMEAALAFEEVIRTQAYNGQISPTVTFATLVGKTTIISPEVLVKAGVPCCRLVQNAGEFVVTFPRAYHSGFNHGFNCTEAVNIATPGWLTVAREAAIRRVSIDIAPMVSYSQLMYDLALSLFSSSAEPQSSRLKDRMEHEGDAVVKHLFIQDVMSNNELLDALANGSPITLLSEDFLKSLVSHGFNMNNDFRPKKRLYSSYKQLNKKADPARIFSCVTCGSPCYSCIAIVQPSEEAAHYLMSNEDVNALDPGSSSGKLAKNSSTTEEPKHTSVLNLLVSAYGDSSDSEEDSKSTKFAMESNRSLGTLAFTTEVTSAYRKPSLMRCAPMNSASERDSSRMHVFCLEHAHEVEQRLRPVGGVCMLLLCHQDYREINDAARSMGKEVGVSHDLWTNVGYIDVTEQDKVMIRWALDDEETATSNNDWAVKLGIDIFHTAKLCRSQFYKKKMPCNSVIYKAFGQYSPSNDQMTPEQSGRQKKIIMAEREHDIQEEDHETVFLFPKMNVKHEKPLVVRENTRKRKRPVKGKFIEVEASPLPLPLPLAMPLSLPLPLPPADSPHNCSFRRQETSKATNVVDKKAQESDLTSDKSVYKPVDSPHNSSFMARKTRNVVNKKSPAIESDYKPADSPEKSNYMRQKTSNARYAADKIARESDMNSDKLVDFPHNNRFRQQKISKARNVVNEKPPSFYIISSDESDYAPADSPLNCSFRLQKTSKAKNVVNKKARESDINSSDENDYKPADSPLNRSFRLQNTSKARYAVDKKAQESDSSSDESDYKHVDSPQNRSFRLQKTHKARNAVEKTTRESVGTSKPKKHHDLAKNVCVDATSDDEEGAFCCDIEGCDMRFKTIQDLKTHKLDICIISGCQRMFISHKYLLKHMSIHEDEGPLTCPWKGCHMRFKCEWARNEHISEHTGRRPYLRVENCCDQTRSASDFSRHEHKTGHVKKLVRKD